MGPGGRRPPHPLPPRTIGEYFTAEQPLLAPLPQEPFETGRLSTPRVDR
ncbi:hypothetical protein [Streptomyces sp. MC1]|nr:hypothetical protein [Streptomyces sp. MC1]